MRSVYKLVVCNHMNLVRIHHLVPMYDVHHVHMSRRDYHVMISRSPIHMMRRNRSWHDTSSRLCECMYIVT